MLRSWTLPQIRPTILTFWIENEIFLKLWSQQEYIWLIKEVQLKKDHHALLPIDQRQGWCFLLEWIGVHNSKMWRPNQFITNDKYPKEKLERNIFGRITGPLEHDATKALCGSIILMRFILCTNSFLRDFYEQSKSGNCSFN